MANASRVILMSPTSKNILLARNLNNAEKENQEHPSIIVRASREKFSSDSDSDGWSSVEKKKKTSGDVPHYVTRGDGPQQRKRPRVSAATSPTPSSLPSHVIARRNERERNRVRQVNDSFAVLRSHIPEYLYDEETMEGTKASRKKLSKVETLRLAVHYIQKLEHLLDIKASDSFSDDDRLFGSETQMSSVKTEGDSDAESDIMDLSSDQRRSPVIKDEKLIREFIKYEDDFVMESVRDTEVGEGSLSPYSSRYDSPSPPAPPHQNQLHLPSISTFPTKSHPLSYSDLYSQ